MSITSTRHAYTTTLALRRDFKPDLIHCSSPGVMVFAAKLYAWLLKVPLALSYHTHVPSYLPRYGIEFLVPAMWAFLRLLHATAHLTLTVSPAMVDELANNRAVNDRSQIQVRDNASAVGRQVDPP